MNDNDPFAEDTRRRRRARIALVFGMPLLLAAVFMLGSPDALQHPWTMRCLYNPGVALGYVKDALKALIFVALFVNIFVIVFTLFMILREKMGSLKIGAGVALASVIGIAGTVASVPGKPVPVSIHYARCITMPSGGGFHGYSAPAAAPSAAPAAPAPTGGGAGA